MEFFYEDLPTWLSPNRQDQASFAHAELPAETPVNRVEHLVENVRKITRDDGSVIVFLVPDALECRWLLSELHLKKPTFMEHTKGVLHVYDYATFYGLLREGNGDWQGWQKKQITIICDVDVHFSAGFIRVH